jgi:putative DNA primase/helicase
MPKKEPAETDLSAGPNALESPTSHRQVASADPVAIRDWLSACFGDAQGWAHVAIGHGGHYDAAGHYRYATWREHPYWWPQQAQRAVSAVAAAAVSADVHVSPYLTQDRRRAKGTALMLQLVHTDADGDVDPWDVLDLSGFAVASGTPGHAHVYTPLSHAVTPAQHELLCRGLGAFIRNADPKFSDNDVLRPAGTFNHKSAARGGAPSPVVWLVDADLDGPRVDPFDLAAWLGVDLAHAEAALTAVRPQSVAVVVDPADTAVEPVELDGVPAMVRTVLARNTGDRSEDIFHVAGACYRAGLTLAQARFVVSSRPDLAARLAEHPGRDEVAICWAKAVQAHLSCPVEPPPDLDDHLGGEYRPPEDGAPA